MSGPETYDITQQLSSAQVRKLLSYCRINNGNVRVTRHALEKAALTGHSRVDIDNVLQSGICDEAGEWDNEFNTWKYRFHTSRFAVVVVFEEISSYAVITFWEKKGGAR